MLLNGEIQVDITSNVTMCSEAICSYYCNIHPPLLKYWNVLLSVHDIENA